MFEKGAIWAYPTDTSFGLGVRCDDLETLQKLYDLKERLPGKFFSLMVKDEAMLKEYAEMPHKLGNLRTNELKNEFPSPQVLKSSSFSWEAWFQQKPRTAILKPSKKLPRTPFWPEDRVAFRICTLDHYREAIEVPITATSANISGQGSIFSVNGIRLIFGEEVLIDETFETLPQKDPSEIWDFTQALPKKIR